MLVGGKYKGFLKLSVEKIAFFEVHFVFNAFFMCYFTYVDGFCNGKKLEK